MRCSPRRLRGPALKERLVMYRRIVPGTLWVGILFWVMLLFAHGVVWASRLADRVPNVVGAWDGFFQEDADAGLQGQVLSNITGQVDRSIAGYVLLLDMDRGSAHIPCNFCDIR